MCVIFLRVVVVVIIYIKIFEVKKVDMYGSICIKG